MAILLSTSPYPEI